MLTPIDIAAAASSADELDTTRDLLTAAFDPSVTPRGVYRAKTGLRRWRQSLGRVGKTIAGTGLGGVDIVIVGDSIAEGGTATSYAYDRWSHRLKVRLQNRYNPAGVLGGYGYVPSLTGNPGAGWSGVTQDNFTFTGTWTRTDSSIGNAGARVAVATATTAAKARYAFDGTDSAAAQKRSGVSKLELIARHGSGVGNWSWDVNSSDAFITTGTGDRGFGTITGSNNPTQRSYHHGDLGLSLNPAQLNVLQVTAPASGTLWFDGAIAYNGDWDCGVRVHNLGNWGATAGSFTFDENGLATNFDYWGAAGTGATHAKLFILDPITNDVGPGTSPVTSLATFTTQYTTLVQRALACASKPSVLAMIPPLRGDGVAGNDAIYDQFRDAIYGIADANDHVAVLDLWAFCDDDAYSGRVTQLGWSGGGSVHYSDTAQEAWASILFDLLTSP